MRKKTTAASAIIVLFLFIGILPNYICAEDRNCLKNYHTAEWSGDSIYLDKSSNSLFFKKDQDKSRQTAAISIDIEQGSSGFLFYVDIGNGSHNDDNGYCTISFYDENKEMLLSVSTGIVKNLDNYSRFSIGKNESYFPLPEDAKTAEITINSTQSGNDENINVYFKNFTLLVSNEVPLLPEEKIDFMNSTIGLTKVEIGLTPMTRWIWVAIVFLVALSFLFIAKWQQKYKTAKIMKGTDRKIR